MTPEYAAQVRAWAAELREGSVRTWDEFLESPTSGSVALDPLPTAAQLEVVRRLPQQDRAGLADLVLATPAAWRGAIDVPLPWHEPRSYGAPAVAPEALHPDELLRVLGSAITTLLLGSPETPEPPQQRGIGLFRKRFVLLGAPTSQRVVSSALRARGLREGGPKSTYVVLGGPLESLMAQRWAARVRAGSTIRWRPFWRYARNHDRIPPGIRVAELAERLAREVGGHRVHLVLASSTQEAMDVTASILGVPTTTVDEPGELLGTDLLRVVNAPLTLAVGEHRRGRLVAQAWPALVAGETPRPIGAPRHHLDWALRTAEREVERIVRGSSTAGYAVHGHPGLVVPDPESPVPRAIRRHDTLDLGLQVLARAWNGRERGDA